MVYESRFIQIFIYRLRLIKKIGSRGHEKILPSLIRITNLKNNNNFITNSRENKSPHHASRKKFRGPINSELGQTFIACKKDLLQDTSGYRSLCHLSNFTESISRIKM